MTISENTSVTIKIGSAIAAVIVIGTVAIRLFVDETNIADNMRKLHSLQNYSYAKFFPEETWSKNYLANHTWNDE